jgi:hypothetical protein
VIVFTGETGRTLWQRYTARGARITWRCLNDQREITVDDVAVRNVRALFREMDRHSETLNGRTLSVSELTELV